MQGCCMSVCNAFFRTMHTSLISCVLLDMAITFTVEDVSQTYNISQMQNYITTSTAVVITQSLHACAPG